MARPRRVDMELVTQAQVVVAQATDVDSLGCAQAVLLPAVLGATLEQTAIAWRRASKRVEAAESTARIVRRPRRCTTRLGRSAPCLADLRGRK